MKRLLVAATVALLAASTASAGETGHHWTGFSLGLTGAGYLGHATDFTETALPVSFGTSGFVIGAIARLDVDFGRVVVGAGFEWTYTSVAGSYAGDPNSGSFHLDRTATVLFRLGYDAGKLLFYAQGGFNFSRVTTSGGPTASQDTDTVTFHSGLRPGYGWHAGVGIERAFTRAVSGFVEYRYVNIGDELVDLGPTNPGTAHFVAAAGHTLRVGISFRFGG